MAEEENKVEAKESEDQEEEEAQEAEQEEESGKSSRIVLDYNMDPSERLEAEKAALGESDPMGTAIAEHLLKRFETDPVLKEAYQQRKVTLKDVVGGVNDEARKFLKSKNGAIPDETVYGWAVHIVQDGKIPPREKEIDYVLTKEEEADARHEAIKAVTDKEIKKIKKKAASEAKKQALEEERKRIAEEREAKKAEKQAAQEEAAKAKEKKKAKEAGFSQMSLFDL